MVSNQFRILTIGFYYYISDAVGQFLLLIAVHGSCLDRTSELDDYRSPLCFDTEGWIDRDGKGRVFFSDNLHGQVQKFLDDNSKTFLQCPVRCRLILEIEQKIEERQT